MEVDEISFFVIHDDLWVDYCNGSSWMIMDLMNYNLSSGSEGAIKGAIGIFRVFIFSRYSLFNWEPRSYLEFPNHLTAFICKSVGTMRK